METLFYKDRNIRECWVNADVFEGAAYYGARWDTRAQAAQTRMKPAYRIHVIPKK